MHLLTEPNAFLLTLSTVADGTRATNSQGTSVTPGNNTYGSYVSVLSATSDVGYELEINCNSNGSSAAARDALLTIGLDLAGGTSFTDFITDLLVSSAATFTSGGASGGVYYRFPIRIPAGASIGAKASVNNGTVGTVRVFVKVKCKPTRPDLLRVGAFVRTFGSTPASSSGTAITPGGASEGTYTQIGSALAEPLWGWEFGLGVNNATMTSTCHEVDVAVGDASNKRIVISNHAVFETNVETITKFSAFTPGVAAAGDLVYVRIQTGPNAATANTSVVVYGIGG